MLLGHPVGKEGRDSCNWGKETAGCIVTCAIDRTDKIQDVTALVGTNAFQHAPLLMSLKACRNFAITTGGERQVEVEVEANQWAVTPRGSSAASVSIYITRGPNACIKAMEYLEVPVFQSF